MPKWEDFRTFGVEITDALNIGNKENWLSVMHLQSLVQAIQSLCMNISGNLITGCYEGIPVYFKDSETVLNMPKKMDDIE